MKIGQGTNPDFGTVFGHPFYHSSQRSGDTQDAAFPLPFTNLLRYSWFWEDFRGSSYTESGERANVYDFSPTGTPAADIVADTADGVYRLTLTNNSQVEQAALDFGLNIPGNKKWWVGFRFKVHTTAIVANELVALGLSSTFQGNVEGQTTNAQFLLDGSMVLKYESDDNTTDAAAASTGITLVADTYCCVFIDGTDTSRISFQYADSNGDNWREVGSTAAAALSTTTMAPYFALEKTTGVTTPSLDVDWVIAVHERT